MNDYYHHHHHYRKEETMPKIVVVPTEPDESDSVYAGSSKWHIEDGYLHVIAPSGSGNVATHAPTRWAAVFVQ